MAVIRWNDFRAGLWLVGPREANPQTSLRRAKGVAPLRSVAARSRSGTLGYFSRNVHSMVRFADEYVMGHGTRLAVSAGRAINSDTNIALPPAGGPADLDGTRLTFVQMQPTSTVDAGDYLFVAGGGSLQKVDATFAAPTRWGIEPPDYTNPPGGPAVSLAPASQLQTIIDNLEDINDTTDWNETGTDSASSFANDTTRFTQGVASMRLEIGKDKSVEVTRNITTETPSSIDLSAFAGPTTSFNEDYIVFDVRVNRPKHIKSIGIAFDVDTSGGLFKGKFFSRDLKIQVVRRRRRRRLIGTGDIIKGTRLNSKQAERDFVVDFTDATRDRSMAEFLGEDTIAVARRRWTRVTIPKAAFETSGDLNGDNSEWAAVRAIRFSVETNKLGGANVNFDRLRMIGGVGMQGDYQYHFTFKNSVTGTRSNPDPVNGPLTIKDIERQAVTISNLPQAPTSGVADPQVDTIEIWRTLGNGEVFFKALEVAHGTTSVTDSTADYIGLGEGATTVLDDEELPLDNDRPADTFEDAVGPYLGRMWWARDTATGGGGRVYFSPAGRAEALESFIEVASDTDATQKLVIFDQRLYLFSTQRVYQIVGTDESTFRAVPIFGTSGTTQPFSVVPTPAGIAYRAWDGVRLFDGATSRLVADDAVAPILRNSTTDGLVGFVGDYGAYGRGEYYLTDSRDSTRTTFAIDATTGAYRHLGFASSFLYFDAEADILFGRRVGDVFGAVWHSRGARLDPGTFTVGSPTDYAIIGSSSVAQASGGVLNEMQLRMPRAATATAMYVFLSSALTGSQTLTTRINVNGTPSSALTVTHTSATGTLLGATGSLALAQDDLIALQFDLGGGLTSKGVTVSIAYTVEAD